jgi:hypothetical protein
METKMTKTIQMLEPEGTSKNLGLVVRKWLAVLAESYQYEVSSSLADIWTVALSDLPMEWVELGFQRILREWTPDYGRKFPAPGTIRKYLEGELENARVTRMFEKCVAKLGAATRKEN